MKKLLLAALAAASLAACEPARAQSVQCSDRSAGDSTNACANTRFVMSNAGFWMADGSVAVNNSAVYPTVRITRSNVGDAGGTLQLGHGNYMWTLIGNQLAGGDLILRNPAGGNVLVFPETGGCVGIQAALTSCAASFMLDIGPGSGNAWMRINGATFTNNQGPMLAFSGGGTVLGRIGADCVFYGATLCNNNVYVDGPASSRNFGFFNWAGVFVTNTPTAAPTRYVGGALTVNTDSSNAFVGGNAITAQSDINTGGNFPTGLTVAMNIRNTTSGGPGATVWGIYSHCDLHATNGLAECASIEGTLGNRYGAPNPPAVATIPGQPQPFLAALKGTCGGLITNNPNLAGLFGCSVGLWLHYYEGNGGWPFLYGVYLTEGVATTAGIFVQATSSTPMATAAEFRSAGGVGQRGVVIRNMGASSANIALDFQNSAGATVANIQFNGVVNFNNGGVIQGLSNLSIADSSGFNLRFLSVSAPAMTANRSLTFDVSNVDRTIDIVASGTMALLSNTLGDFAATTSAQLRGVISDEVGTGFAVFNDSPVFANSITAPIVAGGSAANSSLILRSTAGAGTSDAMVFQTGSQVEAGRITTGQQYQIGSNFAPNTGVKVQISANSAALPVPIAGTILQLANVDATATRVALDTFGTGIFSSIIHRHARGTNTTKSATQSGDLIGSLSAFGYQTTTGAYLTNAGSAVIFVAIDNFTSTAAGSRTELWATQSGTTTSEAVLRADKPTTATQTALTIYDVDNNALERVTVGAADGCGAGFKCLRIPN